MIIKPHFIILCREAFLQQGSNNLNLIGIFTQLNADKMPFQFARFAVVVNFDIDVAGDHTLHTEVVDPSGKQIARTNLPIKTNVGNWQVIAQFEQMQFATAGTYTFRILIDDILLGERTLSVVLKMPSTAHQKIHVA